MARVNSCSNPSCINDLTGWVSGKAITRLTGLSGPPRSTGAQISIPAAEASFGSSLAAPKDPVCAVGDVWTGVGWYLVSVTRNLQINITAWTATGSYVSDPIGTNVSVTANTWTQIRVTGTISGTGAVRCSMNANMPTSVPSAHTVAVSSIRLEKISDAALTYSDGDSVGWLWDGTAGSSTSQESGLVISKTPMRAATARFRSATW